MSKEDIKKLLEETKKIFDGLGDLSISDKNALKQELFGDTSKNPQVRVANLKPKWVVPDLKGVVADFSTLFKETATFSGGTEQEVRTFCDDIETAKAMGALKPEQVYMLAISKIKGAARNALARQTGIDSWEKVREFLVTQFAPCEASHVVMSKLMSCAQAPTESVQAYYNRYLELYDRAILDNLETDDEEMAYKCNQPFLLGKFIKGLYNSRVRELVYSKNPEDLQSALQWARYQEQFVKGNENEQLSVNAVSWAAEPQVASQAGTVPKGILKTQPALPRRGCFECGSEEHFARSCAQRTARLNRSRDKGRQDSNRDRDRERSQGRPYRDSSLSPYRDYSQANHKRYPSTRDVFCLFCGKPNHYASQCRQRQHGAQREQPPFGGRSEQSRPAQPHARSQDWRGGRQDTRRYPPRGPSPSYGQDGDTRKQNNYSQAATVNYQRAPTSSRQNGNSRAN